MTAPALRLEKAGLQADGDTLLGPLSLHVETAGITAVMGANGAGKSLFLRLCHGLLTPSQGRLTWAGRGAVATRRSRAFVFQSPPLLRRSIAENVTFPLQTSSIARSEWPARVEARLREARLWGRAGLPAARLSGGERQRMALARALVTDPDVILMDEPAASLDPASTRALEKMITKIAASGVKIYLATHDVAQARRLAEDVLFFSGGRLAEQADAAQFFAGPQSEAARQYLEGSL